MAKRKQMTGLQRAKFFEEHKGICHICGVKIKPGEKWDDEHKIPRALANEDGEVFCPDLNGHMDVDDMRNRAPAHVKCHRVKTSQENKVVKKGNRIRAKHIGAWVSKTPMKSKYKKKVDGTVVDDKTGEPVGRQP